MNPTNFAISMENSKFETHFPEDTIRNHFSSSLSIKNNKIGINSHLVVVVVALVVDGTMVVVVVGAVLVVSVLHHFEELFLFGVLHRD